MPRLIDKRCAIKHLKELLKNSIMPTEWYEGAKSAITLLQKEPTVDAVEVVRCKDCKYYDGEYRCCATDIWTNPNGYCHYGERKEDAETD